MEDGCMGVTLPVRQSFTACALRLSGTVQMTIFGFIVFVLLILLFLSSGHRIWRFSIVYPALEGHSESFQWFQVVPVNFYCGFGSIPLNVNIVPLTIDQPGFFSKRHAKDAVLRCFKIICPIELIGKTQKITLCQSGTSVFL